jgi:hypothetical protein
MTVLGQAVLKRIAALLVAGGTGFASGDAALDLPEEMLEALLDSSELARYHETDRARIIGLLARDARPHVRQRLAISLADLDFSLSSESEALLEALARDSDPRVVRALGAALGTMLGQLTPLERAYVVSSWAGAEHEGLRFALAFALAWPIDGVGVRSALHVLEQDSSQDVRTAAARAIRMRSAA